METSLAGLAAESPSVVLVAKFCERNNVNMCGLTHGESIFSCFHGNSMGYYENMTPGAFRYTTFLKCVCVCMCMCVCVYGYTCVYVCGGDRGGGTLVPSFPRFNLLRKESQNIS